MADLTVQTVVEAGIIPTYAAAAGGGDAIPGNDGQIMLHVKNGGGGSITVTIAAQTTAGVTPGLGPVSKANAGGSVANASEKMFGPFPVVAFNDGNGKVQVTYSGVTSVTVAAIKLPRAA